VIPRRSVIGLLLFILCINDIGSAIIQLNFFADYTLLSVSGEDIVECIDKMQKDLNALSNWLKFNKSKLNVARLYHILVVWTGGEIGDGRQTRIFDIAVNFHPNHLKLRVCKH
jgi:hypothetical protein